jgi:hypothetical protein
MQVDRLAASIAIAFGCVSAIASCTVDVHVILPGLGTGLADDDAGDGGTRGDSGDETHGDDHDDDEPEDLGDTDAPALDLGAAGLAERCLVTQLDAPLPCDLGPTSKVIEPTIAWTWTGPNGEDSVLVTPLVANLDDDNFDGAIDLCDTPELVVLAVNLPAGKAEPIPPAHLYVIDGRSGTTERVFDRSLDATATPAIADLDGDGAPELIAFERVAPIVPGQIGERRVIALSNDGKVVWISDTIVWSEGGGAIAIADLDADGSPEILAPEHVLSADGELLWAPPEPPLANSVPIAADLDLDGDLEVLFGASVYSHDGELLIDLQLPGGQKNSGMAAIANFDADEFPEIYIQSNKHRILEHDGTPKAECMGGNSHPVAVEDLDGDGQAEILSAHGSWFSALTIVGNECVTLWSRKLDDVDATASGTAFDLLADGSAEAIYADLQLVRLFDDEGQVLAQIPRTARSTLANPVVVDADNDGAAEIVLVGSEPIGGDAQPGGRASVLMIQNIDDRFAPTRRIWNQHAYHGTNIREDAGVPAEQTPHWLQANGFRTNSAPAYVGDLCQSPPTE